MNQNTESWNECPKGKLQTLCQQLRQEERARKTSRMTRIGMFTSAAVLLIAVSFSTLHSMMWAGGISCFECGGNFVAYESHLTNKTLMAATDVTAMQDHFDGCFVCRYAFESKYPGLLTASNVAASTSFVVLLLLGARLRGSDR